ncbi:MAG TPA: MFS transporter, partial [Candidatus Dormibacteraeota bacterium]|nr:MFS transporter [Candidatus Dormibacteraeota bacterium]
VAYYFHLRFGLSLAALGPLFFATNLAAAASYLAAARLARRIGLLNTMVFTHLPSNGLLMLVAAMPTWPLAAAVLFLRNGLSQMDVPTRQAYLMALVSPDERSAAAGVTGSARTVGAMLGPLVGGLALASPVLGLPLLLGGGLKAVYDGALYLVFHRVRLPDEGAGPPSPRPGDGEPGDRPGAGAGHG